MFFLVITTNIVQGTSFPQNRFGEKQYQVFVSVFHFLAIEALI